MTDAEEDDGSTPTADRLVDLRVHHRRIVHADGDSLDSHTVRCAQESTSRTLEHCARCPRFQALRVDAAGSVLQCRVAKDRTAARPRSDLPLEDSVERTPVTEVAFSSCICLDPELAANEAVTVLHAERQRTAPVVDDAGVLIGMVEAEAVSQLVLAWRRQRNLDPEASPEVEDAMSAGADVIALSENASVGDAARLMACTGIDRLPIVTHTGEVVGVVTALDPVGWLARHRRRPH